MKHPGTFLGRKMAKTPLAISTWERVLAPLDFARIIELGTTHGVFSYYLYLFCKERKAQFWTFDIKQYSGLHPDLYLSFECVDVFSDWGKQEVFTKMAGDGITILFCDNGDKSREAAMFAVHLKPGDILAVHDWETEIFQKDIPNGLIDITPSNGDQMTRFFKKC